MRKSEVNETRKLFPLRKLLFPLLAMFLTCHLASTQVKVSIVASPQFNENFGVRAGTDLDIPLNSRWSIVPGVYWSLRHRDSYKSQKKNVNDNAIDIKSYNYHDKAHFLTVPIRMGVRLAGNPDGDFMMKLLFGPYIAYGINGKSKCTMVNNGIKEQTETGAFDADGRYRYRWDYGINGGVNVTLKRHLQLGVFLEMGYRKIYNPNSVFEDIIGEILIVNKINLATGLSIGYKF